MRTLILLALLSSPSIVPAGAQTELDRILVHVYGSVITRSDVTQARLLKLVADVATDQSTQRALEDRLLMLVEVDRAPAADPLTDQDVAALRREWEARVGPANVVRLLSEAPMSEPSLQAWLRDDARVRAYIKRQFGAMPDADRPRATADWVARLRQRAGLK